MALPMAMASSGLRFRDLADFHPEEVGNVVCCHSLPIVKYDMVSGIGCGIDDQCLRHHVIHEYRNLATQIFHHEVERNTDVEVVHYQGRAARVVEWSESDCNAVCYRAKRGIESSIIPDGCVRDIEYMIDLGRSRNLRITERGLGGDSSPVCKS